MTELAKMEGLTLLLGERKKLEEVFKFYQEEQNNPVLIGELELVKLPL